MSCESETDDYEGKDSIADCDQVPYIYADVMPQGHVGQDCHCNSNGVCCKLLVWEKLKHALPCFGFR